MAGTDGTMTGEQMVAADNEQYKDPAVIAKMTERLKTLGGNPPPVVNAAVEPDPEPDPEPAAEPEPGNEADPEPTPAEAGEPEPPTPQVSDPAESEPAEGDNEVVIPEHLHRAATHFGWKPEKIKKLWEFDEDVAKDTLNKLHEDMINVSNDFAQQGRAAKELQKQKAELEQNAVQSVPQQPAKPKNFVDIEKAKEEFGDGAAAIIDQLQTALLGVISQPTPAKQPDVNVVQQRDNVATTEQSLALVQQLAYWHANPVRKKFDEFYGAGVDGRGRPVLTSDHVTMEQRQNRERLVDKADDIHAGIHLRGGRTTITECLDLAHDILTVDLQKQMIRKDIMKSAKKRAAGVTLRPSGKKIEAKVKLKEGQKMTDDEVYQNAEKRAAQLAAGKPLK
jgi:hypothetical protein